MPRICYTEKKFRTKALHRIAQANVIITDLDQQGYKLTLRQLYYQFVARGLLDNTMREYKNLGIVINDARLAGRIDWDAIEDRTRKLEKLSHWDCPADIINASAEQYRRDKWEEADVRIEVWVEKDALVSVIGRTAERFDVAYMSTRGYGSQSEMWGAAQRFEHYVNNGQRVVLLHLSDHDPSGVDMTRDIDDRLNKVFGVPVDVQRIALTMAQVRQYSPPPNPAKTTDSRAAAYIDQYGDKSWELDALHPSVIDQLIADAIMGMRDDDIWRNAMDQQNEEQEVLRGLAADTL